MNTVEENFEADKIQAAIDYLEYKDVLNKIKAQAIEEAINATVEYVNDPTGSGMTSICRAAALKIYILELKGE